MDNNEFRRALDAALDPWNDPTRRGHLVQAFKYTAMANLSALSAIIQRLPDGDPLRDQAEASLIEIKEGMDGNINPRPVILDGAGAPLNVGDVCTALGSFDNLYVVAGFNEHGMVKCTCIGRDQLVHRAVLNPTSLYFKS